MNDMQQYEAAKKRIAAERLAKLPSHVRELESACPAIYRMFERYANGQEGYLEALESAVSVMAMRMMDIAKDFSKKE